MKCSIADCPGEYEQRELARAMRQDERIIVVAHIPAEVCNTCGDVLFTPETIERLEELRRTTRPPASTMPLYNFAESV
ncbi:MAG TPA: YgiT-type zinc finger protein [Ktedonobacteraceae bacterium]|nr:YgiT-type zinc finger protein [Ktedonobacteraceae bacterium]